MWAYDYMKGWKQNKKIDFNFHDAHDLNTITNASSEADTKNKLRARFFAAKQAVVLIGESTKNLHRFVRWEIEVFQNLELPIVAVNLNKLRKYDPNLCPPILRDADAIHVSFNARIIKHAFDNFCENYSTYKGQGANFHYKATVYEGLGL